MTIEEKYDAALEATLDCIPHLGVGTEEYKAATEAAAKMYKARSESVKDSEMISETKKKTWIDTGVSIFKAAFPWVVTFGLTIAGMNFERENAVSSSFFRNVVTFLRPKGD